jgi:hypothetical protein
MSNLLVARVWQKVFSWFGVHMITPPNLAIPFEYLKGCALNKIEYLSRLKVSPVYVL